MLFLAVKNDARRPPGVSLKLPRVRFRTEPTFRSAVQGDIETIKSLLVSGDASPLDVSSSSGLSSLQARLRGLAHITL